MNEKFYAMEFYDHSFPGFIDASKMYIGNRDDLIRFADKLDKAGIYAETAAAVRAYFAGDTNATHEVYRKIPVLTPVELIASSETVLNEWEWEHTNVWRCTYPMKADKIKVSRILIKHNDKYKLCVKAEFSGLCYFDDVFDKTYKRVKSFWGLGEVFETEELTSGEKTIRNILYVKEGESDSSEELKQKMSSTGSIEFKEICNDIFGDG